MADPTIEAARSIVDTLLVSIRQGLTSATREMLNWRPAGPESNAAAVLAVYA